jgi:alkylation response protein AidB-like acyl-CoA dehydrogenase
LPAIRWSSPAWQDSREALAPELDLKIENGRLDAVKLHVPSAFAADSFLVMGTNGAALVKADAPGVAITTARMQDGGNVATVVFDNASATVVDADTRAAFAEAALATSAYLLGLCDAALAMTVDYLKTRVQFGKPIGSFQALQHMAVDLKLEAALTRASIEDAALSWDESPASMRSYAAISRAHVRASRSAMSITASCVQLHGGIGFTDEHDIGQRES